MKRLRRIFYFFLVVMMVFLVSGYYSSPGEPAERVFTVQEGETVDSIIERLAAEGHIRSQTIFWWDLRGSGLATMIQPGDHDLAGVKTYDQIIERLTAGGVAETEATLLIREGESLRDIKAALESENLAAAEGLYEVTGSPAVFPTDATERFDALRQEYDFLADVPANASLEGFLFPDTYRLFRDVTAEDVVRKLLDNFDRKLTPELRADIERSGHSLYEVVIMASVLEREVRGDTDRQQVADIFWRRMVSGMRMQSCATVNYVLDGKNAAVSYEDTQIDSPYNTYRNDGLPVGPIGNPGLSALTAAANPLPNDYWYFLTDEDGNVHYARTLDEHNRNKATYLK